jgi:NAD+ kinase
MKNRIKIISDKNKKSIKYKSIINNILIKKDFSKPNLIIVIGGDGFMLQTLKKNKNNKKKYFMELILGIMVF